MRKTRKKRIKKKSKSKINKKYINKKNDTKKNNNKRRKKRRTKKRMNKKTNTGRGIITVEVMDIDTGEVYQINVEQTNGIMGELRTNLLTQENHYSNLNKIKFVMLGEIEIAGEDLLQSFEEHGIEDGARLGAKITGRIINVEIKDIDTDETHRIDVDKTRGIRNELMVELIEKHYNKYSDFEFARTGNNQIDEIGLFQSFEHHGIDDGDTLNVKIEEGSHKRDCGLYDGHDRCTCDSDD